MSIINCEISLDLTQSVNCVTCREDRATTVPMTDTKQT